jgi:ATP-dependent helicase HrpB
MPAMLPIDPLLPEIVSCLEQHGLVLLQAPPGAGKTSSVAPALLQAPWRKQGKILLLEPRRLAARRAAEWMARQRGERLGQSVGLRTRLESRISANTQIEVVTEGILLRLLQNDPALSDYAAVLFDEFHERSLPADLGLALLRESAEALRDDLRIVVMSATLDTEQLQPALGMPPLLRSEGKSFPVETLFRPARANVELASHAANVVQEALETQPGSVLVFLPGMREIRRLGERLHTLPADVELTQLHGQDAPAAQQRAIAPAPAGKRKVVLASAIAESSLTIEGVRVVVDAGLERYAAFDPNSGMESLRTRRVSRASADQRRGRAGRTEAGVCYRLWSEEEGRRLPAFAPPAIREADLAPAVLELAQWGARSPEQVPWLEPPPQAHWRQACELLTTMALLTPGGALSMAGQDVLRMGLHPRLGVMVRAGRTQGLAKTAARLAAILSERDPMLGRADSQLWHRLQAFNQNGALPKAVRQSAERLQSGDDQQQADAYALGRLLAEAYPDRIARRRQGGQARFQLSNGRGAFLPEDDGLAVEPWLVAASLDGPGRESRIQLAAPLSETDARAWLTAHAVERETLDWDDQRGFAVLRRQRFLGAMLVGEKIERVNDPEQQQAAMIAALRRDGLALLGLTERQQQWLARVRCLHQVFPDDWPAASEKALLEQLEHWLAPFLPGVTNLKQLRAMDLQPALDYWLGGERCQRLARLAPTHWTLPTGQAARIDYLQSNGPVLAVKLQTLFGCEQGPRVADGRMAVVLHLLSPAQRPLAVTSDLASFWRNAYADVRRDMRGRYPKHPWPEDPLSASPQAGTKRRG